MPPSPGFGHGSLWRSFPWDRTAADGEPYSVRSVAPARYQNYGRFDLGGKPLVLYLAQSPEHAVAETLRGLVHDPARKPGLRHALADADLVSGRHRRALAEVRLPVHVADRLPDMSEGKALGRFGIRADELSSNNRATSQRAARRIHGHSDGVPGFVWSSRFGGDHHVVLLFLDRVALAEIEYGAPDPLHLAHPAVITAAAMLNVDVLAPGAPATTGP